MKTLRIIATMAIMALAATGAQAQHPAKHKFPTQLHERELGSDGGQGNSFNPKNDAGTVTARPSAPASTFYRNLALIMWAVVKPF